MFKNTVFILATLAATSACSSDEETYKDGIYFVGHVYDGATDTRLKEYSLSLQVRDRVIKAKIDAEGRYLVGPLPPWQDFTVSIEAGDYRKFLSHNAGLHIDEQAREYAQTHNDEENEWAPETYFYDAYVFANSLKSPEVKIEAKAGDDWRKRLTGTVSLKPINYAALGNDPATRTAIENAPRVWRNDEDFQSRAVTKEISDSVAMIPESELLYGMAYQVSLYNVAGYTTYESSDKEKEPGHLVVGRDLFKSYILAPQNSEPLAIAKLSNDTQCAPNGSPSTITLTFNKEFELVDSANIKSALEAGIQYFAPSESVAPALSSVSVGVQGTELTISTQTTGSTRCYQYGATALGTVNVRIKGDDLTQSSLADLLKKYTYEKRTNLTCQDFDSPLPCNLAP